MDILLKIQKDIISKRDNINEISKLFEYYLVYLFLKKNKDEKIKFKSLECLKNVLKYYYII